MISKSAQGTVLKTIALVAMFIAVLGIAFPAPTQAQGTTCPGGINPRLLNHLPEENIQRLIYIQYDCFYLNTSDPFAIIQGNFSVQYNQMASLPSINSTNTTRNYAAHNWPAGGCSIPSDVMGAQLHGLPVVNNASGDPVTAFDWFEAPCNEHDYCYATVGISKETCDGSFYANMIAVCNLARNYGNCYTLAAIMAGVVAAHPDAHEAYRKGQANGISPFQSWQPPLGG